MDFQFREDWREIKRGRPGHRFRDRYARVHGEKRKGAARRIVLLIVGLFALALGGLLAVLPGPAIPFFIFGGALLAAESRAMAVTMDWSEVKLRQAVAWGKPRWRRLPAAGRVAVLALGACCSAASVYLAFWLMRG